MIETFIASRRRPERLDPRCAAQTTRPLTLAFVGLLCLASLGGCTGPTTMTDKQKEAYELRRYCEKNPDDIVRCLGFLGDH
jgi:hypothetical protein